MSDVEMELIMTERKINNVHDLCDLVIEQKITYKDYEKLANSERFPMMWRETPCDGKNLLSVDRKDAKQK
jgi:hypothetical protein